MRVRQVEFLSTVETDPVGAVLKREHAALVMVPTAKDKLEDLQQRFSSVLRALATFATSIDVQPLE